MQPLRLRILCLLLVLSLGPLSLLLAGLHLLPAGFLGLGWIGLLAMVVTAISVGVSGYLVRPVRDLAIAVEQMLRPGGEQVTASKWVSAEYAQIQRAFSLHLHGSQRGLASTEAELLAIKHKLSSTEAESLVIKQKLLHSDRLIQRALGITQGILHATGDGVFVQDKGGNVIASNQEFDKILGRPVEKSADVSGARLLAEMAALFADATGIEALISKTGEDIKYTGDVGCLTVDEPPRILSVHTAPVLSATGSVMGRLWITRDITGQRRLAEQLKQAQKMEAIGQLTGGIAHDFNNLLTAIRGNLALAGIASADKPEAAKENIEGATRATIRAAELVKQLLGYSRKTSATQRSANLNKVVSEVENILRHSIDPRVTVQCELASDLWLAQADPMNIEQVILNLCLNARDALPEAGGRIDISTVNRTFDERTMPPPDVETGATEYVVIRVKDNGSGIPEEKRAHIFDPFFSTKAAGKGTGLGLVMAHDIVKEHGGWIEFDSEVGKGTEFRVYLPKSSTDTAFPDDGEAAAGEVVNTCGKSGSILIVDDEDAVRSIAVAMLKHLGYDVTQACDGEQALEKIAAAEKPFNAILLDIFMPKLSGRDTFKRLRADGCQTPVVVCSGFKVEPDQFQAQSEASPGAFDIIQKPYSMDGLARTIEKAVAHGRPALAAGKSATVVDL